MSEFNIKLVRSFFISYDVTNIYEIVACIILLLFDVFVLTNILLNIRRILDFYYNDNEEFDPRKLICININLIISVVCCFIKILTIHLFFFKLKF